MNFQEQLDDIKLKSCGFSHSNIALTQKVYSDLVLAKRWKEVEYKPVKGLDMCVILANEPEPPIPTTNKLIIVPIHQDNEQLSIKRIKETFQSISDSHIINTPIEKFTYAIYSSDSTIVYYHINQGLVKPTQRNSNKA